MGGFFIGGNMEISIYNDFLSKSEIEFLTGRKNKSLIIKQLNIMGIPFKENANGYPVVRRDYDSHSKRTNNQKTSEWAPAVLRT